MRGVTLFSICKRIPEVSGVLKNGHIGRDETERISRRPNVRRLSKCNSVYSVLCVMRWSQVDMIGAYRCGFCFSVGEEESDVRSAK